MQNDRNKYRFSVVAAGLWMESGRGPSAYGRAQFVTLDCGHLIRRTWSRKDQAVFLCKQCRTTGEGTICKTTT